MRNLLNRFRFTDGLLFTFDIDVESWKVLKIGGSPLYTFDTGSEHDCSGRTFCKYVDSYLFGFITVGHYAIDC